MRKRTIFAAVVVLSLLTTPSPARAATGAAPGEQIVMVMDEAPAKTMHTAPRDSVQGKASNESRSAGALSPDASRDARKAEADDLKTECAQHAEARTDQGWARSRFEQCFLGLNKRIAWKRLSGATVAYVDVEYSLLAFSYDGSRRIDYFFSFDDFKPGTASVAKPYIEASALTISFWGCGGEIQCSKVPAERTESVLGWEAAPSRSVELSVTSDDSAGAGTFKILNSLINMRISGFCTLPDVTPFEQNLAWSRARFDTAGPKLGAGKQKGTVFTDFVPTVIFDRKPNSDHFSQAVHVDDALHRPTRTFPSVLGKSVPGEGSRPLHRLMVESLKDANARDAKNVCKDIWGNDYANGGLECDEFPFQSSYEGAYTSTIGADGNSRFPWQGSARAIDGKENGNGGTVLLKFYGENRILDETHGTENEGKFDKKSDPFNVKVVG